MSFKGPAKRSKLRGPKLTIFRQNCHFFEFLKKYPSPDAPPSLDQFVSRESWLIFDIIGQDSKAAKWLNFNEHSMVKDVDYKEFVKLVKNLSIVRQRCF